MAKRPNLFEANASLDDPTALTSLGKTDTLEKMPTPEPVKAGSILDDIQTKPLPKKRAYTVYLTQANIDALERMAKNKGMAASRLLDNLLTKIFT